MATISQHEGPLARSSSPHPGPFRIGQSTVKPSPAKPSTLANNSQSGSFEGEGSPSARQLLRNVKLEDEQDADNVQSPKKRRPFVKKSSSPSQQTPGGGSMSRHYNKLGILYSSSPDFCSGFSPSSPKSRGLLGVPNTSTLPPGLGTNVRFHEGHPAATPGGGRLSVRPASFHSGAHMAVDPRMVLSQSESTGDVIARDPGCAPEAVGRGTGAVGGQFPTVHESPDVKDSDSPSPAALQQNPSPPISLRDDVSSVEKPGTTSASSPDSGYGNTPENNPGTVNTTGEGGSPPRLQARTCSDQPQRQTNSDEVAVESDFRVVHHEFSPEPQPNQSSQTGHPTNHTSARISLESAEVSPHYITHLTRDPRESTSEEYGSRDTQRFGLEISQPLPPSSDSIPPGSDSIPPGSDSIPPGSDSLPPPRLRKQGLPRVPSVPDYLFARVDAESATWPSPLPRPAATPPGAAVPARASVQYMRYDPVSREFNLVSGSVNSPGGSPKFAESPKDDDDEIESLGQFRDRTEHVQSSREILKKLEAAVAKGRQRSHSQPLIKAADVRSSGQLAAGGGGAAVAEEKDYFQVTDELAKENSHFAISEALLAVIEQYKANSVEQLDEGVPSSTPADSEDMPDHAPPPPVQPTARSPQTPSGAYVGMSGASSWGSSGSSPSEDPDSSPRHASRVSLLELIQSPAGDNSAESTAQRLLQHVAVQLTGSHGQELSMSQLVLQLPTDFLNSLQLDEDLQKSVTTSSAHMRGSKEWAPPRAQIIFHIKQPSKNIQRDLAAQGYRCTGCGMKVEPSHVRYFRFCNYTGKYFCQNCHSNALSMIPAYVIERWSFKRHAVSNFARDLLVKIHQQPAFNVQSVNHRIYSRVPVMVQARELRKQLIAVKNYLKSCRRAQNLNLTFEGYAPWTTDVHIYSMEDFVQLKNGTKLKYLRALLTDSIKHVRECPLCQGKGFVCEFCRNSEDIIYPFEINRVKKCKVCQCCFHKECFSSKLCPRCIRIEERQRQRLKEIEFDAEQEEPMNDLQPS